MRLTVEVFTRQNETEAGFSGLWLADAWPWMWWKTQFSRVGMNFTTLALAGVLWPWCLQFTYLCLTLASSDDVNPPAVPGSSLVRLYWKWNDLKVIWPLHSPEKIIWFLFIYDLCWTFKSIMSSSSWLFDCSVRYDHEDAEIFLEKMFILNTK